MKPIRNASEILSLPEFRQVSRPLAITAPFVLPDRVLIGAYGSSLGSVALDLDPDEFQGAKAFLYEPKSFRACFHGIQRIWESLELGDPETKTDLVTDTELMAYLLDSDRDRADYSVSHLTHQYLGEDYRVRVQDLFDLGYPEALYQILSDDAHLIFRLASELSGLMTHEQKRLLVEMEIPIALILAQMHRHGIGVDGQAAALAHEKLLRESDRLAHEITSGSDINLWNGHDVYALLKRAGVKLDKRNNELTQEDLKNLARHNPLAAQVLRWRDLTTDLSFLEAAAGKSRIHPEWNVLTKTGRIYASDPPVQNASKAVCRPLLIPAPGHVLIKADYRQLQMRLLANLSGDAALVESFQSGRDVHRLTVDMCSIEGASDQEKRDQAKAVNYGILFQMTAQGLAHELDTDAETAQQYIEAFWARYKGARNYLDRRIEELENQQPHDRVLIGFLGRARRFVRAFGPAEKRQAKATILQQLESEILKLAVIRLYWEFRNRNMRSRIVMILHDAIWVEAPEQEAEEARKLMQYHMEDAVAFTIVPLEVEFE